jgi:hypothetical protein
LVASPRAPARELLCRRASAAVMALAVRCPACQRD